MDDERRVPEQGDLEEAVATAAPGTRIVVREGAYELRNALRPEGDIVIEAEGDATLRVLPNEPVVVASDPAGPVTLRGFRIERSEEQMTPAVLVEGGAVVLENCVVHGPAGDEAYLYGTRSQHRVVAALNDAGDDKRAFIDRLAKAGCGVVARAGAVTLRDVRFAWTSASAVLVSAGGSLTVEGGVIERATFTGLVAWEVDVASLTDVTVRDCGGGGVVFDGGREVLLEATVVTGCGGTAIGMRAATMALRDCEAERNAGHGFELSGDGALELSCCRAEANGICGIAVFDAVRGAIVETEASGNGGCGLLLAERSAVRVADNRLLENGMDGLAIAGDARPEVGENVCERNRRHAVYVERTAHPHFSAEPPRLKREGWLAAKLRGA